MTSVISGRSLLRKIDEILGLSVTTTQLYTVFHILHNDSIDLWKKQIELILKKHGLMSFVVHPDYVTKSPPRSSMKRYSGTRRGKSLVEAAERK
jgi:hypothetical protein